MNLTDVDDKTIRDSKKEKKSLKEFTEFYTKAFLDDISAINIGKPDVMPKATEHINEMVEIIQILLDKGMAYKSENGDIYFSIETSKSYGRLAALERQELKHGASGRISSDEYSKEGIHDFALWKAHSEDDGNVFWETEIGKGRPGWHIECSAMSSKYLGQPFDIHMGGIDLIFPHHTNEIAQSEGAHEKKFCNYWVHNAHLIVNGEKMSKSAGNFYTLRDLLGKGHDPIAIRYTLLSTHYRHKLDFRESSLKEAKSILEKFRELLLKLGSVAGSSSSSVDKLIEKAKNGFESAMDDDLNIAKALNSVFVFVREVNKIIGDIGKDDAVKIKSALLGFDSVLGIMKFEEDIPEEIKLLAEERLKARKAKDWKKSDSIRDDIKKKGYSIDDTKEGYVLKNI